MARPGTWSIDLRRHSGRVVRVLGYVAAWLGVSLLAAAAFFLLSSREVVLASHDSVLRPTLDGHVVLRTGPVLPDVRIDSGHLLGVTVQLGKTDARSTGELVQRYAVIASQPEGQVHKIEEALADMAYAAALRGAVVGLLPVLVWLLLGAERRRELLARTPTPGGALSGLLVVSLVLAAWQPWRSDDDTVEAQRSWVPLSTFLGDEVPLPAEVQAAGIEVRGDVTTNQTKRLIRSAVDTFDKSKRFYAEAAAKAAALDLHQPAEDETVAVLVSDRHDNIGMDPVARAVGDAGGATTVLDAGDDTSTGSSWEAFSLDSLDAAFDDLDRWGVAGNHDHGSFVHSYLDDHGWRMLEGEVVTGPGGGTILGVDDPRSSGLGSWRDETGLSFDDVTHRIAEEACGSEERVNTILVHDANLGAEALRRGCADVVLAGHLHVQVGPDRVVGTNGQVGYSYTNGTTGGAAYAIAVGSKPRREAEMTLVTYRDGRPVGIQPVVLQTNGVFHVRHYKRLRLAEEEPVLPGLGHAGTRGQEGPLQGPTAPPSQGPRLDGSQPGPGGRSAGDGSGSGDGAGDGSGRAGGGRRVGG